MVIYNNKAMIGHIMKMYVFHPRANGKATLFVMAQSAELAAQAMNAYRKKHNDSYSYGTDELSASDLDVFKEMQVDENY